MMEESKNLEKKFFKANKKKIIIILSIIVLCIAIISTIFAVINSTNEKIIKGVKIQDIDVSGLTKQEAKDKLSKMIKELSDKDIILKYGENEEIIKVESLEIKYNFDEALNKAYEIGRSGNILKNNFDIIRTRIFNTNINMDIKYNQDILNKEIDTFNSSLPGVVEECSYCIEEDKLIISKGKPGITINKEELNNEIKDKINNLKIKTEVINIPIINKQPDKIDLEKIHQEIYREPQDAYISQDPVTVHPHVNGVDFAITMEEAQKILQEDKDEYEIPLKITIANKTVNDLGEEAFPNTLGTFTTRYDASNKNRSNNIVLASSKINGTVILPGETFSYNKTVGKRTITSGFKEAGAYAGGKVIQEVGGGICQVSSTLYNAVLYANLEIVDRSNHYFECSYVDAGRDATVSWGTVDFKFRNNRTYPIKIEAYSKNGVVKISIKGIKEEKEHEVTIQSKITSIIKKTVQYIEDPTLEIGEEVVEQEGHNGCTSKTYKIVKYNGTVVSNDAISSDSYHALEKIVRKGTKQVKAEEKPVEVPQEEQKENVNNVIENDINND
jgi:vancomycin resistance protein YoaR